MALDLFATVRVARARRSSIVRVGTSRGAGEDHRAIEGDQRIAALDRINRTLATKANRPCLLALKITTLLDMKDMQSLEDTVTTFVKVAPDNVLAHTFAAMLESRKHRVARGGGRASDGVVAGQGVLPG